MNASVTARSDKPRNAALARLDARYRRAGATTVAALGARGISVALSLVTVPLTVHYLGAERYGMWMTISSLIALLSFSDIGIGSGLLNAVTRSLAHDDEDAARRSVSSATAMLIAVALTLGLGFVILYPRVEWQRIFAVTSSTAVAEAGPATAAWLGCFLLTIPLAVGSQVRIARQEGYIVHAIMIVGNLVSFAGLLIAIQLQVSLPALVFVMAGPPVLAAALNCVLLFGHDARQLSPIARLSSLRIGGRLLQAGFLFFILQVAIAVAFTSDSLVAAQFVGPVAVAQYAVAAKLFMLPGVVVAAILAPLWPAYGEAIARRDVAWARKTLVRSIRLVLLVSVPASFVLALLGQPLVRVWVGDSVVPPVLLLAGFALWTVMSAIGTANAMFLNGAHEIRAQAIAAVVMASANITLSIWLASRIGVAGVMWGTVISYSAFTLVPMAFYVPRVIRRIEMSHLAVRGEPLDA